MSIKNSLFDPAGRVAGWVGKAAEYPAIEAISRGPIARIWMNACRVPVHISIQRDTSFPNTSLSVLHHFQSFQPATALACISLSPCCFSPFCFSRHSAPRNPPPPQTKGHSSHHTQPPFKLCGLCLLNRGTSLMGKRPHPRTTIGFYLAQKQTPNPLGTP